MSYIETENTTRSSITRFLKDGFLIKPQQAFNLICCHSANLVFGEKDHNFSSQIEDECEDALAVFFSSSTDHYFKFEEKIYIYARPFWKFLNNYLEECEKIKEEE